MEAFKLAVNIDNKRKVVVDLPPDIPLGKAEMIIIVQPLTRKRIKPGEIDLKMRGISIGQAAEMRNRVLSFEEDWNAPGMEVY
ncbi:hypothetical protein JW964_04335 [candidate division KSB1 bacterium]|nr:hypothetical protein [candidate division KSB1 bacterium]